MALQFIFGPSGAGKSYQTYQQVIKESMEHMNENYIILVPEQFTMQTQKDLVNMHPRKGILNIDILSFHRLAYRIFEETGEGNLPILDDEGKNLVLRKVAKKYDGKLQVLQGNMKKLGYITEVKSVISELVQYDITPEELGGFIDSFDERSALYYKLQDIKLLYEGYLSYMDEKFLTKEDLMDVLARAIPQSALLKGTTIIMDGFTGFTPVQLRAVKELMEVCKDIRVTITMDGRENPFSYIHDRQLFAISKKMVKQLIDLAKETDTEVKEPVWIKEEVPYRFTEKPALAHLEKTLFRSHKTAYEKEQEEIVLHSFSNPKKETYGVAELVRKAVREEELRYKDIGVIVSDLNVYSAYVEQAFGEYHIPIFMDYKRNILLNPFVECIRSILAMADQDFSYISVFRFLRTNLTGFTYEQVDHLENYCLAKGIRGYKSWKEQWNFRTDGQTVEDLELMNELRKQFVEQVDPLVTVLKKRKKTIREITEALYDFMVAEEFYEKLKSRAAYFTERQELALAKEHEQIYKILLELFDKLVELLGEEAVSIKEYTELLDAGLAETKVGVIPPGVDQVVVGDVERTRLKDVKVLFFLGANDTHLPGMLMKNGLLSENDRKEFAQKKLALAPCGKEKIYIQKFYLYSVLTKPSERLHVSYSNVSSEGKTIRPAYLVGELKKIFPGLVETKWEENGYAQRELTEETGFEHLLECFRKRTESELDQEFWEMFCWYKEHPAWKDKVDRMLKAGFLVPVTHPMSETLAKALYGKDFRESISRMEKYFTCAYMHFLTYGLRLSPREEFEFAAFDLGNICHKALELYGVKLEQEDEDWISIEQEKQEALMKASVEEAISGSGKTVLYSTARNEQLINRIQHMMKRTVWALKEQLSKGDFRPAAFEHNFGNGKIDRVDLCEDGDQVYVKVMDYKTGKKSFDIVDLYYGLQLQLMTYMIEALKYEQRRHPGKEVIPAGVFYYRIQDPIVDEGNDVERNMLKELIPDGVFVSDEQVINHLDHSGEKGSIAAQFSLNKDGSLSKWSKGCTEEAFQGMMHHAEQKMQEAAREIKAGRIDKNPYRRDKSEGCEYCQYQGICGFDLREKGYAYRELEPINPEEALKRMVDAVKEDEYEN